MITLDEGFAVPISTRVFDPFIIDPGGVQMGALGGEDVRVNRPGQKWGVVVQLPTLDAAMGRIVSTRLSRAVRQGIRLPVSGAFGQQGIPGVAVTVASAVTGGTTLALAGLNPGWVALEGYWLTVVGATHRCLHKIAASGVAAGDGTLTLTVEPPLRVALDAGDDVLIAKPTIDGLVVDDQPGWAFSLAHHHEIAFTVRERR